MFGYMLTQNIPNLITILRILISPMIWCMIIYDTYSCTTLYAWIVCILSDALDGMIARIYQSESKIGAYLDPIADKFLINGALISLIYIQSINGINVYNVLIIFIRDITIIYMRSNNNIPVSIYGKYKTILQTIAISMYITNYIYFANITLWIATIISIYSLIKYIIIMRRYDD